MNKYLVTVLKYCGDHSAEVEHIIESNRPLTRDEIIKYVGDKINIHDEIKTIEMPEVHVYE